jgi:4-amino-4-deoxy-L-arabinose transferase-like glycosyltransferase
MHQITRNHALLFMVFCLMVAATLRLPELAVLPGGVHYDEAANAVLTSEIAFEGYRPLFITSYTGKEVLFFYFAAGLMRLLGDGVFVLRLTAVFFSLLTIAATYRLGLELSRDRRVALLAAALLAVNFWHLLFSRTGFRVNTQPLLQALTVIALLHGYCTNSWRWLGAAGIFLGLAAYTYLAVRLFPVLLLLALLPILLNGANWQRRWGQTAVVVLIALFIAAPLLNFFRLHPETFWVRIEQVAPGAGSLSLPESYLKSLGMIFLQGDPYMRFNVPGRPLLDWFWGGLLLVGWLTLVIRWRRLETDWQRAGSLLLILAPFIMVLPTALAVNEIVPSNIRAIGLIPFIFILPPLGLITLLDDLHARFGRPQPTRTAFVIAMLVLVVGGLYVERLYFRQWATRADLFFERDGDLAAAAKLLEATETTNKEIYVATEHYQHPTLALLSDKYEQVKWLLQSEAVVFPAAGTAVYIYPHNSPLPDWAAPYFSQATLLPNTAAPDGSPAFVAYELARTPPLTISHPVSTSFGSISLLGYDVAKGTAGETLPLTVYWRVNQSQSGDFAPFVHLEDAWGHRWSQVETFAYPASQWAAGEMIVQQIHMPIPPGTPPGDYKLRVGLFSGETGERLARLDEDGRYAGNSFPIENISLQAGLLPDRIPEPSWLLDREIQPHLRLLGFERGGTEVATGEPYGLALWWLATQPISNTITQFALVRPSGSEYIILETQPVHNSYPFTDWQTPQFLIDTQTLTVPADVPAGEYQLVVRFLDERGEILKRANLGALAVQATQRLFTPPSFETAVNATFGNEIQLLGYSLNPTYEPGKYSLNLIWQAQQRPTADYTVFVHLLQADGSCNPCVWQQDSMPQQGQYPTSRWQTGEVVIDSFEIVVPEGTPPGSFPLEVGLYLAEDGRRLQASLPDGTNSDAIVLETVNSEQ